MPCYITSSFNINRKNASARGKGDGGIDFLIMHRAVEYSTNEGFSEFGGEGVEVNYTRY